jgi:hypothetical protein
MTRRVIYFHSTLFAIYGESSKTKKKWTCGSWARLYELRLTQRAVVRD